MFSTLPAMEADIDRLIAVGRFHDAVVHMAVGVQNHYKTPEVAHHALYYPGLDRRIEQLVARLEASIAPQPLRAPSTHTLIIATELYTTGGHSRVVEDFARELDAPTLILTDLFSRHDPNHLDWLHRTFADTPLITLAQRDLWAKCRALRLLTQRLQPRRIFHFNHHQDPVGFIGTLAQPGARHVLVHHADHNPSLGVTLPGMAHADFTDELAAICARELQLPTHVLPLYVADAGRKTFTAVEPDAFSVVTSGTQVKFAREGEFALRQIVRTVLSSTRGRFFHIGPLDDDWRLEIVAHLQASGLDADRFVALGAVPSLWGTLAEIDAHVYLGSAPVFGARAAIEAQGCGYPLAWYRVADASSLLAGHSMFADESLGWGTLGELAALLSRIGTELPRLGEHARGFYEQRFSRTEFRRVLDTLGAD